MELQGTNVYAPIVPGTTDDKYGTHYAKYGIGGLRTVANEAERLAIPPERREEMMEVTQADTGVKWRLEGGVENENWTLFENQRKLLFPGIDYPATGYEVYIDGANGNDANDGIETAPLKTWLAFQNKMSGIDLGGGNLTLFFSPFDYTTQTTTNFTFQDKGVNINLFGIRPLSYKNNLCDYNVKLPPLYLYYNQYSVLGLTIKKHSSSNALASFDKARVTGGGLSFEYSNASNGLLFTNNGILLLSTIAPTYTNRKMEIIPLTATKKIASFVRAIEMGNIRLSIGTPTMIFGDIEFTTAVNSLDNSSTVDYDLFSWSGNVTGKKVIGDMGTSIINKNLSPGTDEGSVDYFSTTFTSPSTIEGFSVDEDGNLLWRDKKIQLIE